MCNLWNRELRNGGELRSEFTLRLTPGPCRGDTRNSIGFLPESAAAANANTFLRKPDFEFIRNSSDYFVNLSSAFIVSSRQYLI